MKITKVTKKAAVKASRQLRRKVIKASRSTADMLDAFEAKLAEFGIESDTKVNGCGAITSDTSIGKEVEITDDDYAEQYEDLSGGFGADGVVYSMAEIKEYWNNNYDSDPVLIDYDSFEDWWSETAPWMKAVEPDTDVDWSDFDEFE